MLPPYLLPASHGPSAGDATINKKRRGSGGGVEIGEQIARTMREDDDEVEDEDKDEDKENKDNDEGEWQQQ